MMINKINNKIIFINKMILFNNNKYYQKINKNNILINMKVKDNIKDN